MREKKTIQETREVVVETIISCDLCGKKADRGQWDRGCYRVEDTEVSITIRHESGDAYPGDYVTKIINFDICPGCFENKLVPYLLMIRR